MASCCRSLAKRLRKPGGGRLNPGPAASILQSRARIRGEAARNGKPKAATKPKAICEMVQAQGDNLTVKLMRGLLTVSLDGKSFELFTALRSQGCLSPAYSDLQNRWRHLRDSDRELVRNRLGASFKIAALRALLTSK